MANLQCGETPEGERRERLFGMSSDRSAARSLRDLRVWQKAHEFVLAVYRYSESFPEREKYGLGQPTASCGRFHSCQYRRGIREA
jgi:23S rRNA-intervening sequence protein